MEGSTSREPGRRSRRERLWLDAVDTTDGALDWEPAPRAPTESPAAPVPRASVSRAWELQIAALAIGLMIGGLLLLVAVAGDQQFWLNVGGVLVVFGLAFDLYARVIGTDRRA